MLGQTAAAAYQPEAIIPVRLLSSTFSIFERDLLGLSPEDVLGSNELECALD